MAEFERRIVRSFKVKVDDPEMLRAYEAVEVAAYDEGEARLKAARLVAGQEARERVEADDAFVESVAQYAEVISDG